MMSTPFKINSNKNIEPQLYVGIEIKGQCFYAGDLYFQQIGKEFVATFTYCDSYLYLAQEGKAFALDPINLPLVRNAFVTAGRYERLGVLFDAAPDAWGRTVMAIDEKTSIDAFTESQVLIKGRGMGVGAIFFSSHPINSTFKIPCSIQNNFDQIPLLFRDIQNIEQGLTIDDDRRLALKDSWDIGGARPKAIVYDELGAAWIAKFPRKSDTYSRQRVEWANLEMAREIGMTVPDTQLVELIGGDCAILIKRFDRGYDLNATEYGFRQHYLSAASLVSPPHDFDKYQMDSPYGASYFSYASIAGVVRKVSDNVTRDLSELYARMILNVLVNNTDDHLKNTGFLINSNSKNHGLKLAPLFDVVTQEAQSAHMLHLGPGVDSAQRYKFGREGTIENILSGAKSAGIKLSAAKEILNRVQCVLARRLEFYKKAGMDKNESDIVETRLNKEIIARRT